jgi:hypothetical protein
VIDSESMLNSFLYVKRDEEEEESMFHSCLASCEVRELVELPKRWILFRLIISGPMPVTPDNAR